MSDAHVHDHEPSDHAAHDRAGQPHVHAAPDTLGGKPLIGVAINLGIFVAQGLLKQEAREVDLVARIGGDEFAALLVDSTEDGAIGGADRMRANVEALGDEIGVPMGLSIGIVQVDPDATVDSVMSSADRAMYECKRAHRALRQTGETG